MESVAADDAHLQSGEVHDLVEKRVIPVRLWSKHQAKKKFCSITLPSPPSYLKERDRSDHNEMELPLFFLPFPYSLDPPMVSVNLEKYLSHEIECGYFT